MPRPDIHIQLASTAAEYEAARHLITAYLEYLAVDLCFQGLAEELEHLSEMYGPPASGLLLAFAGDIAVGCVAVRQKEEGVCEMKRMFVLPQYHGTGIGRLLGESSLNLGRHLGYHTMVLDTLDRLRPALGLYRSMGFEEIPAYYSNPLPGAVYLQKRLQ